MAIKKKKRTNRSSFKALIKQDKFYKELYHRAFIFDYKECIHSLSKERYINKIFFNPRFVLNWSFNNNTSLDLCKQKLDVIYSNFSVDDIYTYLKLHYEINKDKNEISYFYSLIDLINSLSDGYLNTYNDYSLVDKEYFVFGPINCKNKFMVNVFQDLYNGYGYSHLQKKYGFNRTDYIRKLKEIYQSEVFPIDISQLSYY